MKNILIAVSVLSTVAFGAGSTEDFFYKRGYEAGYNAGFSAGVEKAFKEAKAVLNKYQDQLTAYEIGKYLISSSYITYPQVWQERNDNGEVKLKVSPSQIQKPLNIDELFTRFSTIPQQDGINLPELELTVEQKNSVYLSNRDSNHNEMSQPVGANINSITLSVPKSAKNLDILKQANVVFSDEGESYNILFFTDSEKSEFCKNYDICK